MGAIVLNMLLFFGTTLYFSKAKEKLKNSGLEETDIDAFTSQLNTLNLQVGCGYGIAIAAILFSGVVALKRIKIIKQIQALELKELDSLDIK